MIEPEPEPEQTTPDDVAVETINEWPSVKILWQKLEATKLALLEQQQRNEQLVTQCSHQRMQIAELQTQVEFLKGRLQEEKALAAKRLKQVQELRSEVSHVQGLLGESQLQNVRLETLVADLRAVNAATEPQPGPEPVHQQVIIDTQVETIARLNSEIHGLNMEIAEQQRAVNGTGAVNDSLRAETVATVPTSTDDQVAKKDMKKDIRFEQGWNAGTARAVEIIAEWLEPFQTCGNQALALAVLQNLPHIMRSLTGLADRK